LASRHANIVVTDVCVDGVLFMFTCCWNTDSGPRDGKEADNYPESKNWRWQWQEWWETVMKYVRMWWSCDGWNL